MTSIHFFLAERFFILFPFPASLVSSHLQHSPFPYTERGEYEQFIVPCLKMIHRLAMCVKATNSGWLPLNNQVDPGAKQQVIAWTRSTIYQTIARSLTASWKSNTSLTIELIASGIRSVVRGHVTFQIFGKTKREARFPSVLKPTNTSAKAANMIK